MLMPVNVVQWRVEIGVFDALCDVRYTTKFSRSNHRPSKKAIVTVLIFTLLLLFMSGDIELNPVPNKTNSSCKFSVYHWNLNSLTAHNFEKVGTPVRKTTHVFAPRPLTFKFQQEVLKYNDIYVSWSSPKTDLETNFLNLEK